MGKFITNILKRFYGIDVDALQSEYNHMKGENVKLSTTLGETRSLSFLKDRKIEELQQRCDEFDMERHRAELENMKNDIFGEKEAELDKKENDLRQREEKLKEREVSLQKALDERYRILEKTRAQIDVILKDLGCIGCHTQECTDIAAEMETACSAESKCIAEKVADTDNIKNTKKVENTKKVGNTEKVEKAEDAENESSDEEMEGARETESTKLDEDDEIETQDVHIDEDTEDKDNSITNCENVEATIDIEDKEDIVETVDTVPEEDDTDTVIVPEGEENADTITGPDDNEGKEDEELASDDTEADKPENQDDDVIVFETEDMISDTPEEENIEDETEEEKEDGKKDGEVISADNTAPDEAVIPILKEEEIVDDSPKIPSKSEIMPMDSITELKKVYPYIRVTLNTCSQCIFESENVEIKIDLFDKGLEGKELITDKNFYINENDIMGIEGLADAYCTEELKCDFSTEDGSAKAAETLLTAICSCQPISAIYNDKNGHITHRNMYYICFKPQVSKYKLPFKNMFDEIFSEEPDTDNIVAMTQKQNEPKVFSVAQIMTIRAFDAFVSTPEGIRTLEKGIKKALDNNQLEMAKMIKNKVLTKSPGISFKASKVKRL